MTELQRLRARSIGTLVAKMITLSIYTSKTNYQTANNQLNIVLTARNIWNNYGLRGFYNSSLPHAVGKY